MFSSADGYNFTSSNNEKSSFQKFKKPNQKTEVIMKAMKLAMVAVLIASTMVCLANADGFKAKPKKVYNITLVKALHDPGLVAAMQSQIDPGFLSNNQLVYTVEVTYNGALYRITGTAFHWRMFFTPKWKIKSDIKPTFTTRD
jgi:hypothetical protein